MTDLELCWVDEPDVTSQEDAALRALLAACFPDFDVFRTRRYYKQLPRQRVLAWEDGSLVGQVAIEHRVIGCEDGPAEIFGVIDLAVAAEQRGRGIGGALLTRVEERACARAIPFLLLFADDARLYEACGFACQRNPLRWMKVHEHRTLGIGEGRVDELMVKSLGARAWPAGPVDLLGYLF
ncbi:MAG: GNAT family N-acetyltransferase [Pseudomonadales bacterium]|jgi:GNAT superfamily N-acetyltransferase|nr:GNAT family N-acetyltransferase [Pseudomonadales bacterium]